MKCPIISVASAALLASAAWGQADESIIRISTNLVQVEVIVTGRDGKLVPDLQPQDLEVLEDGKPREITAFSLVRVTQGPGPTRGLDKNRSPIPPPPLRPNGLTREQVHRTIAILVDDLNLQVSDLTGVRKAVETFIAEDLPEGDLAAIITTNGGMGIFSQFTADRALLKEAATRVTWSQPVRPRVANPTVVSEEIRALQAGSFGAVMAGIRAMHNMPGRKSIVLFSAGVVTDPGDRMLQGIADEATRAGVTIYPIRVNSPDRFGLFQQEDMATQSKGGPTPRQLDEARRRAEQESLAREDMAYLASQTGGLSFRNDNGLRELLQRVLEDQSAYYLLGYNPGQGSFDRKFHTIQVRPRRSGINVRSRTGYIGIEDRPSSGASATREGRLVSMLLGPFQENDLHTRLRAAFRADGGSPRIQSQLWIDGRDLQFQRGEDSKYHTDFEVVVANFDPQGSMQEHTERAYRTALTEDQLVEVRRSGLLYSITYAAWRPGPYHVRVAVREKSTQHVGTATQFLIAPDLDKNQLALSGIIIKGLDNGASETERPWVSLLRLGRGLEWEAHVYHPKLKKGVPKLKVSLRLYREGELVQASTPVEVVSAPLQKKQFDVSVSGSILIDESNLAGEYALQLIISDENDNAKAVVQALSFMVAP